MFKDKMKSVIGLHAANKNEIKDNIIAKMGSEPVNVTPKHYLKKALTTYAAFLIAVVLAGGGIVIVAEAAEYNRAVSYLTEQGVSIENMTRNEVIALYNSVRKTLSVSSDVSSDIYSVVLSDIPSEPDNISSDVPSKPENVSSDNPIPSVESTVSVNSNEDHEEYGKQISKTADESLFLFKRTEEENNIYTVCLYDESSDTYEILDQSTVATADDPYELGFFTDNWRNNNDTCYFYLNNFENRIGYYVRSTKKTGFLPIDDPDMARIVYFTPQMQYSRFSNLYTLGDRICWIETNYTVGEEEDTIYIYDPEAEVKTMLFKTDGVRWIDGVLTTDEELYVKTAKITDLSCDMEDFDPLGDLYYYNGNSEKMIMVAKDICYFTLDDGVPYIRRTEDGELEKLVPPVIQVEIYTLPLGRYEITYTTEEKINAVTSFFEDINTEKVVDEDPGQRDGMAIIVTLKYADGSEKEITVIDNYIRVDGEGWERMTSYSDDDLKSIIDRYPTDE